MLVESLSILWAAATPADRTTAWLRAASRSNSSSADGTLKAGASMSTPFDTYPDRGQRLLGMRTLGNCRRGYGLQFAIRAGHTRCGYCDQDLVGSYEVWLSIALDHVVPVSLARKLQIPQEWVQDYANGVLACAACNGFDNRYTPSSNVESPASLGEFFALRDRVFTERKNRIRSCHELERAFFEEHSKPLHSTVSPGTSG